MVNLRRCGETHLHCADPSKHLVDTRPLKVVMNSGPSLPSQVCLFLYLQSLQDLEEDGDMLQDLQSRRQQRKEEVDRAV